MKCARSYPNDAALAAGQQGNRVATAALGALPRCPVCGERVLRVDLAPGNRINVLLPADLEPALAETAASNVACHRNWCQSAMSSGMGSSEEPRPEGNGT